MLRISAAYCRAVLALTRRLHTHISCRAQWACRLSKPSEGSADSMAERSEGPLFRFTRESGPYAVGLRVYEQYDDSRVFWYPGEKFCRRFAGKRTRPLQTL